MANLFNIKINWQYVSFLIKRNIKFMVLVSIAMFALYPLTVFTTYILSGSQSYFYESFLAGRIILTVLLVLSIFIVPLNLFSFLNSKRNLDVYHALPIKRQDLFLSVLISAIVIILIPYTIVYTIGASYSLVVVEGLDLILMLKQYLYSVVLSIAILMPILFVMMNTGTTVDGFLYSGLLHVFPALAYGTYILFASTNLLGFKPNTDLLFLLLSTPIYTLFDLNFNTGRLFPQTWVTIVYWLVFSLIMVVVVLLLYRHRKSERAENPFTNKWYFPIFTTALIMVVQVFFYTAFSTFDYGIRLDARTLIFPIMFTLVAYVVLDVIAHRGFKNFFKAIVSFVVITALSLSFFFGMYKSRGFGYITQIPKVESIGSVEVKIDDGYGIYGYPEYFRYSSYYNPQHATMVFKDAKEIEIIRSLHQAILDEYKQNDYIDSLYDLDQTLYEIDEHQDIYYYQKRESASIDIVYRLNNGSKVSRSYQVWSNWLEPMLTLYNSEPYFNSLNHQLADLISDSSYIKLQRIAAYDPFDTNVSAIDASLAKDFALAYKKDYLSKPTSAHFEGAAIVGFVQIDACTRDLYNRCSSKSWPITSLDHESLKFIAAQNIDLSVAPTSDRTYQILLKPDYDIPQLYYSNLVMNQLYDYELSAIHINHEQALELLPYLMVGRNTSDPYNLLVSHRSEHNDYQENDTLSTLETFLILENDLVNEWKDTIPITTGYLYDVLFQEVD